MMLVFSLRLSKNTAKGHQYARMIDTSLQGNDDAHFSECALMINLEGMKR